MRRKSYEMHQYTKYQQHAGHQTSHIRIGTILIFCR